MENDFLLLKIPKPLTYKTLYLSFYFTLVVMPTLHFSDSLSKLTDVFIYYALLYCCGT